MATIAIGLLGVAIALEWKVRRGTPALHADCVDRGLESVSADIGNDVVRALS